MWERQAENKSVSLEITSLKWFTVIGFYRDSEQRFMEAIKAIDGDGAEASMGLKHAGLIVTGVISGTHSCCGDNVYIREY